MTYLFVGAASPINQCIVQHLVSLETVKLHWMLPASEQQKVLEAFSSASLDLHLIEGQSDYFSCLSNLAKDVQFQGIVFAETKGGVRPVKMLTEAFVLEMFQTNVFSFLELIRSLLKTKHLARGASVVALSSVSSIKGLKSKAVYSASKAALDAAVRGVAAELAPQGIRVNSILKGWVDADMSLDFIQSNMTLSGGSDFEQQLLGAISPQEIANLVEFLLSDKVKSITGTNILIDGAYTL